jgi:hypothetical protein
VRHVSDGFIFHGGHAVLNPHGKNCKLLSNNFWGLSKIRVKYPTIHILVNVDLKMTEN